MSGLKTKLKNPSNFRILYIITLFLTNLTFVQVPAILFAVFLFFWGIYLVRYKIKYQHCFDTLRFSVWIVAFLAMNVLTLMINITWGTLYTIVMILHVSICFFCFYGMHTEEGLNPKAELYIICKFIIYATTIAGIIGFVLMMFGVKFELNWGEYEIYKFIIYENRFTGIYMNPNMLGFISVVSIVCCHIISKHDFIAQAQKPRISRIWLALCLSTNLFSLLLCDSNASMVLCISYIVFTLLFNLFSMSARISVKQLFLRTAALLLAAIYVVGAAFLTRIVCQRAFSKLLAPASTISEDGTIEEMTPEEAISFTHENGTLDSGRIKLIQESFKLFNISPVFGIGSGNIILFSQKYGSGTLKFNYHNHDLHNGYLTVLVSTGIVGFLLFAIFGLKFGKHIVVNLFKRQNAGSQDILPCLFAFCCAYLLYSLFEKALLFDISFMVMWFWYMIGQSAMYLKKYEPMSGEYYNLRRHRIPRHML